MMLATGGEELMGKRVTAVLLAALLPLVAAASCRPEPAYPQLGIARIGERLQLYVTLCGDDYVDRVVVLDPTVADPNAVVWDASVPVSDAARLGYVTVGADSEFTTVRIGAGGFTVPSKVLFRVFLTRVSDLSIDALVKAGDNRIPRYPANADPTQILYLVDLSEASAKRLSPSDIQKRVDC